MGAVSLLSVVSLILIAIISNSGGHIFDSPSSTRDAVVGFEKNECFKSTSEITNWLSKRTSSQFYNRFIRPGLDEKLNENKPLQVNISIDMNSMASVDDLNSEYKIILKIDLEWVDERLKYNCSNKPVTMSLESYLLDRIWSPALGVPNIKDPDTSIIQGETTLILGQLRTDGYIHIRYSLLLNLFCYLNFQLFPFDTQECFIKLESRSYSKKDLRLNWREDHPFRNLDSFQITGFKLINYNLYNDTNIGTTNLFKDIYGVAQGSEIMVKLFIQREWTNYFLEIYLPSVLFVMISWLSFWMNIDSAPARVSLGMTTMLTLVTSSRATRDKLPRISYIQALDIWIAFCTCFIFLSLGEFALVSYIYRHAKKKEEEEEREDSRYSLSTRCNSDVFLVETNNEMNNKEYSNGSTISKAANSDFLSPQQNSTVQFLDLMTRLNSVSINRDDKSVKMKPNFICPIIETHKETNRSNSTRLFCCLCRLASDCRGEGLADAIDRWCRVFFPLSFIIFNIVYWCHYLT